MTKTATARADAPVNDPTAYASGVPAEGQTFPVEDASYTMRALLDALYGYGVTRRELAYRLEVSYSRLEKMREPHSPRTETIARYLQALRPIGFDVRFECAVSTGDREPAVVASFTVRPINAGANADTARDDNDNAP